MNTERKTRKPGGGRKRTGGLQPTGALAKLPPIWVDAETLTFLRDLPNLSEFVRVAINEKREQLFGWTNVTPHNIRTTS